MGGKRKTSFKSRDFCTAGVAVSIPRDNAVCLRRPSSPFREHSVAFKFPSRNQSSTRRFDMTIPTGSLRIKAVALALLVVSTLASPLSAQDIPANARKVTWGKGWVCNNGFVERSRECIVLGLATDQEVRQYLILESTSAYPGTCACPYNVDRAGRRCGGRSAYSRPGGRSPLCYPQDISDEQVQRIREKYPPPRRPSSQGLWRLHEWVATGQP
jgi:hypothetical protein